MPILTGRVFFIFFPVILCKRGSYKGMVNVTFSIRHLLSSTPYLTIDESYEFDMKKSQTIYGPAVDLGVLPMGLYLVSFQIFPEGLEINKINNRGCWLFYINWFGLTWRAFFIFLWEELLKMGPP